MREVKNMNPYCEIFRIVGMEMSDENDKVLEAIENLGFTIVLPDRNHTSEGILCCMDSDAMEKFYFED